MKKLAAVILDDRPSPEIIPIINQHLSMLPKDTDLFVFHGEQNRYLTGHFKAHFVELLTQVTIHEYNRLLTTPEFWEQFLGYDRVLIFQHDSRILRTGIEEFYAWDFIGASWVWNASYPGNGGLSLRNPQIMHEVCSRFPWNGTMNEDHFICMHMFDHKIGKLATIEQADKFSVEAKDIKGSWGVHAPCVWLPEKCEEIFNQYKNK